MPADVLAAHGAVSAQVAVAMAEGVATAARHGPRRGRHRRRRARTAAATAKPVGLVYVAVAGPGAPDVRRFLWPGDRAANKRDSAGAAIEMLLAQVEAAAGARPT